MTVNHLAAPRNPSKQSSTCEDPFVSPATSPYIPSASSSWMQTSYLPQPPLPALVHDHNQEALRHDSATHGQEDFPNINQKSASVSSSGQSSAMTQVSSLDLEKASLGQEHDPVRASGEARRSRGSRDPEKAARHHNRLGSNHSPHSVSHTVSYHGDDDMEEDRLRQEKKAVQILLFLSGPTVGLSFLNALWAFVALMITTFSQPIRICAQRPSFGEQLAGLLGPTINLQLRCIYTPLPPHANEDRSYHNGMLFIVHLLSPFLSFAMMFAAWVLAFYWLASGMVGDPAGQDKRDDGKEAVLGLRGWWERWLMRSVRHE